MAVHKIRNGSLQFYPRKRARKILPSVNWKAVQKKEGKEANLLGFIGYKVGMISAYVKDNTEHSMTKNKRIVLPATIIECPEMKIYSARLYKDKKVMKEVILGFEDSLKSKLKKPKSLGKFEDLEKIQDFDDVKILIYSDVKKTGIKKTPDITEIALSGSNKEKINFIKEKINKTIKVSEVLEGGGLVDIHGVTKGHGIQGPVKRFGISLKSHKSEKGRRRPGSLGPWHPARVTFRVPMSGQTGFQTRVAYNNLILKIGKNPEEINKPEGFHKYGRINTEYVILKGSIPGPKKRPLVITYPIRETKRQTKQKFELIDIK